MGLLRKTFNGSAVIYAVRTSGEKFISSLHCVVKKEKSKRVPELGGRELTDLSPDVLTAYTMAGPLSPKKLWKTTIKYS